MARDAGRGRIPVTLFGVPGDPAVIEGYEAMGIDRACFRLPSLGSEEAISRLKRYAEAMGAGVR